MFEIKNISKKYADDFILRNLSLTIGGGLNFILGASGSGKTTLLKILSGLDQSFDGDVFYCGKSIKTLNEQDKSYFYNNIFGFVWQDFNLRDDLTVLDNMMLPLYLKKSQNKKTVMKILRELKISELANQKTGKLSGGQKQRVAIARELIKNPQVIIADEPTSALDEKSSQTIMQILRDLSKTRTVIIVTHDTSLITPSDHVYELDKGELIAIPNASPATANKLSMHHPHHLSFFSAFKLSVQNIKNKLGRFATTMLSLLVASTLLLVTISGVISGSGQSEFDQLMNTYGEGILDIGLYTSFIDAAGTTSDENDGPNSDITQDIRGLYDLYAKDNRVAFISYLESFNNIQIDVDGKTYPIETSGSVPSINALIAGTMPMGEENEVVVPQSFVKILGISPTEAIGKEILFHGEIVDWSTGYPVFKNTSTTAKIVGVMDTTVTYDYMGQALTYTVDDSFLFSKSALISMHEKIGTSIDNLNILIRAKKPADMIALKDELNKQGIVPIGRFELIEDIVRLNTQTAQQSGSASVIISILSMIIVIAPSLMTALTRKREYAIYKISGYSSTHLRLMIISESLTISALSSLLFLCISPLLNLATTTFWRVNILSSNLLATGALLVFIVGMLSSIITLFISTTTNPSTSLKTGVR